MHAAELYPARAESVDDDTSLDAEYCSFPSTRNSRATKCNEAGGCQAQNQRACHRGGDENCSNGDGSSLE